MDVGFARLPAPVLTALLDGDLATASARAGVALPPFLLEETWLWRIRLDQVRADPAAQDWPVRAVVVLCLAGGAASTLPGLPDLDLPPDLVCLVLLPALLSRSSFLTSPQSLRRHATPIALLDGGAGARDGARGGRGRSSTCRRSV